MNYKSKTKPYQHQQKAFDKSWQQKNFALFMEMGTGKTKVAIDTFGALFQQNQLDTVLHRKAYMTTGILKKYRSTYRMVFN